MKVIGLILLFNCMLAVSGCVSKPGTAVQSSDGSRQVGEQAATELEPSPVNGTRVAELFILPPALQNIYGERKVDFKVGTDYTASRVTTPLDWHFLFRHPETGIDRRLMAEAFLLFVLDNHFAKRLEVTDDEKSTLAGYGSFQLVGLGSPPVPEPYPLWWTLRMEGVEAPGELLKEGDRVLIAMRTWGQKGSSFTVGDFGHATLGVRTIGGDPANDSMINPGSVVPEGHSGSIKGAVFGDDEIPNKVEIYNMWDWLEVQNTKRFLSIDYRILQVSPKQMEALLQICENPEKLNWGSFKMLTNNCANGAVDIYNLLRRIDLAEADTKKIGSITVPNAAIDYASRSFKLVGQTVIPPPEPPYDMKSTPDPVIQPLPDRSASKVYKAVVAFEEKLLLEETAP